MNSPIPPRHQPSQVSPCLRLPDELLSLIVGYALDHARFSGEQDDRTYQEVRDILCVCRRFHDVAIPLLYRRIVWRNKRTCLSLLTTLQAHPEYADYVHDVELLLVRKRVHTLALGSESSLDPCRN